MKQMDEAFRKKCISKEGSYLEKRRSIGGVGAGIVAGSAVLLAAAILLFLMLAASGDTDLIVMGAVLAGGIGLFCLAFILLGIVMNKKRRSGYMEYFVKHAGYSREELEAFDREVLLPDTLYSTTDGKLREFRSGLRSGDQKLAVHGHPRSGPGNGCGGGLLCG